MKKFRILMGAMALTIAAAMIIACTKEKENRVAQDDGELTTVSKEDDMSAYLKQFKEKMQSAAKGDETLSIEDARWHLEAVLNYTYGDARWPISEIQFDTCYYELPTIGGVVSLTQLNEAFNAFSNNVEEVYEECTLPEKRILAIQTKFNTESKDGGISAQIIINTGGIIPVYPIFDSTDYWHDYYNEDEQYGFGKCGPYAGQCEGSGAPHELTIKANMRIPQYGCPIGYRLYYSDYECKTIIPINNDAFMMDDNSPCGYKIYFNCSNPMSPSNNPSHCIPPDDMNYYLSKFLELMWHYQPNGKSAISALYSYTYLLSEECVDSMFWLDIQYGILHYEFVGWDE